MKHKINMMIYFLTTSKPNWFKLKPGNQPNTEVKEVTFYVLLNKEADRTILYSLLQLQTCYTQSCGCSHSILNIEHHQVK